MRMRTKKWARPELAVCPFYIKEPQENKGKWADTFAHKQPIQLELGCGKGLFLSTVAAKYPKINYMGVDLSSDMLGLTKRNIERSFAEAKREIDNVFIMWQDIERIDNILGGDTIDRIYINFCNPWPKHAQHKKRLVHTRQLLKYREFLKDGGEIRFKTDDDGMFKDSLTYFKESGYEVMYITYDLHQSDFKENIETEHEKMYTQEGKKIKFLIAKKLAALDK